MQRINQRLLMYPPWLTTLYFVVFFSCVKMILITLGLGIKDLLPDFAVFLLALVGPTIFQVLLQVVESLRHASEDYATQAANAVENLLESLELLVALGIKKENVDQIKNYLRDYLGCWLLYLKNGDSCKSSLNNQWGNFLVGLKESIIALNKGGHDDEITHLLDLKDRIKEFLALSALKLEQGLPLYQQQLNTMVVFLLIAVVLMQDFGSMAGNLITIAIVCALNIYWYILILDGDDKIGQLLGQVPDYRVIGDLVEALREDK